MEEGTETEETCAKIRNVFILCAPVFLCALDGARGLRHLHVIEELAHHLLGGDLFGLGFVGENHAVA